MQIYLITNKVNGKQYIGQTTCTAEKRWQEHVYASRGDKSKSSAPLYHAIRKYGEKSFCLAILDDMTSLDDLNEKEIDYIYAYNTLDKNFGYNRHEGGNRPPVSTPESRRKAGLSLKGRKFSKEHRERISKALTGKKLSPEHIKNSKQTHNG